VQETTAELAEISNLRGRIERLKLEGEELAKYGPAKHPDKQGLDQYSEDFGNGPVEKGAFYCADPTGRRTGDACDPNVAKVLTKTLEEAAAMIHKSQVQAKVYMTRKALEDKIDEVRGAIMICYPAGLPEWDLMRHCVEGTEELGGTQWSKDLLEPANTALWFSGKQMLPANKLKDHVGRHERTKIVGKIQKKGGQAPAREAPVDAETQKQMMAFYHKRQEEMRKLEADQDDHYTSASWANSNDLKRHFSGVGDIKFR
tara:strand:- start:270 stop:1043 length:774 start_codon:yes stop_codon:yes gene_type:complete